MRDWDEYWLARAELNATMSTCVRRAVGAVAVRDRRSFADAFNGNLPGAVHCCDGGCQRCANSEQHIGVGMERCVCVHAEQNIVAFCSRNGIRLDGATLYQTTFPCVDCLKLLVMSGVREVVYRDEYPNVMGADEIMRHLKIRRFSGHS